MANRRSFLPQELIAKKRDGQILSAEEIEFLVDGLTTGRISEGQIAAFAMAVYFNGMTSGERVALTRSMTASGDVIEWSEANLSGAIIDKHSTGGVGDKVSLMLAPILAACGVFVPMISGRGLGHTGGTLDKLEAIPGYRTQIELPDFVQTVSDIGCAIIGQTEQLAPADRRLYAIRDVTATVESIDLITASILSKKLAAGLDALVMDVKFGSGAFMQTYDDGVALAQSIVEVGNGAGMTTGALITDMNECLGTSAGNAVEVAEAIDYLTGVQRDPRLDTVTRALCVDAMWLADADLAPDAARARVDEALDSGAAAEVFAQMVAKLGGPADILRSARRDLPRAPVELPVFAAGEGAVVEIDTRALGLAVVELGGGRTRADQAVDHAVGLVDVAGLGLEVAPNGRPLARIFARDDDTARRAAQRIQTAYRVSNESLPSNPDRAVVARITIDGVEALH